MLYIYNQQHRNGNKKKIHFICLSCLSKLKPETPALFGAHRKMVKFIIQFYITFIRNYNNNNKHTEREKYKAAQQQHFEWNSISNLERGNARCTCMNVHRMQEVMWNENRLDSTRGVEPRRNNEAKQKTCLYTVRFVQCLRAAVVMYKKKWQ